MALRTVTTDPLRRATPIDPGKLPIRRTTIDPRTLPPPPMGTATTAPDSGPLAQATSRAAMTGGVSSPGGVIDPNYRPPAPPQTPPIVPPTPPPVIPPRTFAPPQAPVRDPRIEELLRALTGGTGDTATGTDPIAAKSAQLEKLLAQLMRGEGIPTGDMSNDPAAQAFAVTKRREAERMQESEAARIGASGIDGSSELASRAAQIREATGQDIAENNADLTNKRRSEALSTAMSGAQLKLSDLARQSSDRQSERSSKSNERSMLLSALLSREGSATDSYERSLDRNMMREDRDLEYSREADERRYQEKRIDPLDALRRQLMEQDVETGKRKLNENQGRARGSYGGILIPGYNDRYAGGRAPWA